MERLLAQFKDFPVIMNAALGVFQESKAEKAMEALQKWRRPIPRSCVAARS